MDNVALITGASSGIGRELARIHAQKKGDLLLVARGESALLALKDELTVQYGVKVRIFARDLTLDHAAEDVYNYIKSNNIEIAILMNNAGFGGYGFFSERSLSREEDMIDLNIKAVVKLTHLLLPQMIERGEGRILNTASTAAFMPGPLQAVYFATKAFVVSFSLALSNELRSQGITVTALCPGPVSTGFEKGADLENSPLFKRAASASSVARKGYRAMERGRLKVVTNLSQAFMIRFLIPFTPDRLVTAIVRKMQQKG